MAANAVRQGENDIGQSPGTVVKRPQSTRGAWKMKVKTWLGPRRAQRATAADAQPQGLGRTTAGAAIYSAADAKKIRR
ncbi:MAG: hypothetical protein ACT6T0_16340 [Nevskia sp.]|uniref:hypothetical protein n=1 Tax=Nevskia sp. TaxID=1929292 RepID=UPI00403561F6